ncbi:unnamed protein product [Rotaria magnacalcarata]|uniref:Uncharacterized protein n=1 Tax=Rotaria magnacalcarata TaxID=392030 RepID=A0A819K0E1_9BILA|nr:unnamed protein product [Rotaria magnacalcarata]
MIVYDPLALIQIVLTIICFEHIDGKSNECFDQEYSPLCFCRSFYRNSILTDLFLSKLSLFQCDDSRSIRRCRKSQFHSPSFDLTQLIPTVANISHCQEDRRCLRTLQSTQHCQQCHIVPSSLTHNNSYTINKTITDLCFYLCPHDKSCGFLCLHRHVIVSSVHCHRCRRSRQNVTCRCIQLKKSSTCLESSYESTTERWMQKRGFPAAGILATLVLSAIVLVFAIKLIYHQIDTLERHYDL